MKPIYHMGYINNFKAILTLVYVMENVFGSSTT